MKILNKLQGKVKIGGIKYKIVLRKMEDSGEIDRSTNTISIDKEMAYEQQMVTLLHEMIHALNGELDEKTVDGLAVGLHQIIMDN